MNSRCKQKPNSRVGTNKPCSCDADQKSGVSCAPLMTMAATRQKLMTPQYKVFANNNADEQRQGDIDDDYGQLEAGSGGESEYLQCSRVSYRSTLVTGRCTRNPRSGVLAVPCPAPSRSYKQYAIRALPNDEARNPHAPDPTGLKADGLGYYLIHLHAASMSGLSMQGPSPSVSAHRPSQSP